jgi:RNA polymerase sigma-70 factor, ECF subfamily
MYRIALNVAISFFRRESTRRRYALSAEASLLESIPDGSSESVEIQALHDFVADLDPLHKALVLLYLDGYSYLEIGQMLGIGESNVATKLSRLKQTMRQELRH